MVFARGSCSTGNTTRAPWPRASGRYVGYLTPKVTHLKDFEGRLMSWETKSKKLRDLFREELSNGMKPAVFTNMLPTAMQDYIYTSIEKDTTNETLKE